MRFACLSDPKPRIDIASAMFLRANTTLYEHVADRQWTLVAHCLRVLSGLFAQHVHSQVSICVRDGKIASRTTSEYRCHKGSDLPALSRHTGISSASLLHRRQLPFQSEKTRLVTRTTYLRCRLFRTRARFSQIPGERPETEGGEWNDTFMQRRK